ncbi:hypothetical protein FA15DRAFT_701779 [Coprinopsis marcescibilis]|uniref:Uncharacterized protein n=1 Tax=Coprinopsis marcescibilis TaxID=230819 RepID=A0A5C3LGC5_COPMA|nr:hypothetical protein FA15DRAFT_701779 [Coprinopsis marcescibilis]
MLCGLSLPLPSFPRKAKRRAQRPIISAPILQGSERMNQWRNVDVSGGLNNDSETYYLVPKHSANATGSTSNGRAPTVPRRPPTPTSLHPLDDNFDAITQTNTQLGTYSKNQTHHRPEPPKVPSPNRRPPISALNTLFGTGGNEGGKDAKGNSTNRGAYATSPVRASPVRTTAGDRSGPYHTSLPPPPPGQNHAHASSSSNNHLPPPHHHHQQQQPMSPNSSHSKGKARARPPPPDIAEEFGEYGTYVQEVEKMFGKQGDIDLSLSRVRNRDGTRENLTIGKVKNGKAPTRAQGGHQQPQFVISKNLGQVQPMKVSRNTSSRSNEATGGGTRPPRPKQDYEEISRRVVESTPDKTVIISTWREQVAREAEPEVETMSVYYVSGDVDTGMLEHAKMEFESFGAGSSMAPPPVPGQGQNGSRSRDLPNPAGPRVASKDMSAGGQSLPKLRESPRAIPRPDTSAPEPSRINSPSWIRPSQYVIQSPAGGAGTNSLEKHGGSISSISSSSSPSSSQLATPEQYAPTPPPKGPKQRKGARMEASTPINSRMPIPSFHPTRDGSLISTIKSSSSSGSAGGLERILETCRPSLVRIKPALGKLGITHKDHLRALNELDPETRDRELKEEALRNGVTLMEWAILVNRLKSL